MPKGVKRVGPLDTVRRVRIEAAKIYKEVRRGQLDINDGRGLTWMLNIIGGLIRDNDLEERIKVLEEAKNEY